VWQTYSAHVARLPSAGNICVSMLEVEGNEAHRPRIRSQSVPLNVFRKIGNNVKIRRKLSHHIKEKDRFSQLSQPDGEIFTISETESIKPAVKDEEVEVRPCKSARPKRRSTGSKTPVPDIKVPDIKNFPLLRICTSEELIAQRSARAMSAPPGCQRGEQDKGKGGKGPTSEASEEVTVTQMSKPRMDNSAAASNNNIFSKAARNHVVADSANFREQRQLERQLRGIQSLERMNINHINKEKLIILQRSKALPSMLYPDVYAAAFTRAGKKQHCKRREEEKLSAETVEEEGLESPYAKDKRDPMRDAVRPDSVRTKEQAAQAWSNCVSLVLKKNPPQFKSPISPKRKISKTK